MPESSSYYSLNEILENQDLGYMFSVKNTDKYFEIRSSQAEYDDRETTLIFLYETT